MQNAAGYRIALHCISNHDTHRIAIASVPSKAAQTLEASADWPAQQLEAVFYHSRLLGQVSCRPLKALLATWHHPASHRGKLSCRRILACASGCICTGCAAGGKSTANCCEPYPWTHLPGKWYRLMCFTQHSLLVQACHLF